LSFVADAIAAGQCSCKYPFTRWIWQ
jgi:hypothetical protein